MITKVVLPKADANMNEGTVAKWLINEGDKIKKGEALVEIVTDKAVFELEAPKSGTLRQIIAPEQSVLPPGYIMAFIGKPDDKLPNVEEKNQQLMTKFLEKQSVVAKEEAITKYGPKKTENPDLKEKVRATPSARRLARKNKVSLKDVQELFNAKIVNEKMVNEYLEKHEL